MDHIKRAGGPGLKIPVALRVELKKAADFEK